MLEHYSGEMFVMCTLLLMFSVGEFRSQMTFSRDWPIGKRSVSRSGHTLIRKREQYRLQLADIQHQHMVPYHICFHKPVAGTNIDRNHSLRILV